MATGSTITTITTPISISIITMTRFDYLTDPQEIERRSFVQIRQLTDLTRFDDQQQQIAMRLVHTSGDPTIVEALTFSPGAVDAGIKALARGAAVLCDVEMLRQGVNRHGVRGGIHCFLNDINVAAAAEERGETRTMAAMAHWADRLEGNIAVIGNAPTALFRLLEMLCDGAAQPALIIGMPVGFINAREAKQALLDHAPERLQVPCITLHGYRGGSTLAAATVNALVRLSQGVRF